MGMQTAHPQGQAGKQNVWAGTMAGVAMGAGEGRPGLTSAESLKKQGEGSRELGVGAWSSREGRELDQITGNSEGPTEASGCLWLRI